MIHPGLDECNPSWFSFGTGELGVITGSQVFRIIRQRIYAFMKAQKMRKFLKGIRTISEMGVICEPIEGTIMLQPRLFDNGIEFQKPGE